ncbi:Uncharacterised protein [Lysinibacillus sphaericus]|nr:Uncharacterised protein [Lysinibacillus sphaericus]
MVVTYMMTADEPDSTTGILVGMSEERTDKWAVVEE